MNLYIEKDGELLLVAEHIEEYNLDRPGAKDSVCLYIQREIKRIDAQASSKKEPSNG